MLNSSSYFLTLILIIRQMWWNNTNTVQDTWWNRDRFYIWSSQSICIPFHWIESSRYINAPYSLPHTTWCNIYLEGLKWNLLHLFPPCFFCCLLLTPLLGCHRIFSRAPSHQLNLIPVLLQKLMFAVRGFCFCEHWEQDTLRLNKMTVERNASHRAHNTCVWKWYVVM